MHADVVLVRRDIGRKRFSEAETERFFGAAHEKAVVVARAVAETPAVRPCRNARNEDQINIVRSDRFRTVDGLRDAVCAGRKVARAFDPHRKHFRFAHAFRYQAHDLRCARVQL